MLGLSPSNRSAFFLHADLLEQCGVGDYNDNEQVKSSDEKEVRAPASEPPPHVRQRKRKHETNDDPTDSDELTPAEAARTSIRLLPHSARPTTIVLPEMDGPPTRERSIRRLRSRLDFSEQSLEAASRDFAVSLNASLSLVVHSCDMDHEEQKEGSVEIVPSSIPSDTTTHDKDNVHLSREDEPDQFRNAADADHVKSPALPAAFPFTQPLESLIMIAPEMSLSARLSQSPPSPTERQPVRDPASVEQVPTSIPASDRALEGVDDNEVMSKEEAGGDEWCFPSASADIPEASMPSRSQSRVILSRRSSSRAIHLPLPLPSSATNSPSFIPTSPSAVSSIAPPSTAASMLSSHVADLELPSQLLGVVGAGHTASRGRYGLSQTSRASFRGSGNASNAASSVLAGASLPFCTPPALVPPVASKGHLVTIIQNNNSDSPASSPTSAAAFQYDPFQLTQALVYSENSAMSISSASSHLLSTLSTVHPSYPHWIARIESLLRVMASLRTDEVKFANLAFLHSLLIGGEISAKQLPLFHVDAPVLPTSFLAPSDTFAPPISKLEPIQGVNSQCWEWIRMTTAEKLMEQQYAREQKQLRTDVVKTKSQLPPIIGKPVVSSSSSRRSGNRAVLPLPLPTTFSQDSAPAHISELLSELD